MSTPSLTHSELLQLQRWNTPTIYNGWEQITGHDFARDAVNLEETRDFMPEAPPICGWAVTVVIQPSDRSHAARAGELWAAYREHLAEQPGPKIVVVQDLDKPACYGAGWGEVNANIHRALGCIRGIIAVGVARGGQRCGVPPMELCASFSVDRGSQTVGESFERWRAASGLRRLLLPADLDRISDRLTSFRRSVFHVFKARPADSCKS